MSAPISPTILSPLISKRTARAGPGGGGGGGGGDNGLWTVDKDPVTLGVRSTLTIYLPDSGLPVYGVTAELWVYDIGGFVAMDEEGNPVYESKLQGTYAYPTSPLPNQITNTSGLTPIPALLFTNMVGKTLTDNGNYWIKLVTYSCADGVNIASKAIIINLAEQLSYHVDADGATVVKIDSNKPEGANDVGQFYSA